MFLIFRGLGFLVPLLSIVIVYGGEFVTNGLYGGEYWNTHNGARALCYFIASLVMWMLGTYLDKTAETFTLVHPETNEKIQVRRRHDFFFLKIKWWSPVLLGISFVTMFMS